MQSPTPRPFAPHAYRPQVLIILSSTRHILSTCEFVISLLPKRTRILNGTSSLAGFGKPCHGLDGRRGTPFRCVTPELETLGEETSG